MQLLLLLLLKMLLMLLLQIFLLKNEPMAVRSHSDGSSIVIGKRK